MTDVLFWRLHTQHPTTSQPSEAVRGYVPFRLLALSQKG